MDGVIRLNRELIAGENPLFDVSVLDEVDSTNVLARALSAASPHSLIVAAECQTRGKGRLDRTFHSEKYSGIYVSFVIHPDIPADMLRYVTPFTAVAVSETLDKLAGTDTRIKWVNDIFLNGKKICGILTESVVENSRAKTLIIGIGINISQKSFPEDVRDSATSVLIETGKTPDRNEIICGIAKRMVNLREAVLSKNFLGVYKSKSCVTGQTVCAEGRTFFVEDINDDCSLKVNSDGKTISISPGEISGIRIKSEK